MNVASTGFCLDFRRVASRRISGNVWSLLLELVFQPLVVALLVYVAFIHRDDVDPYRLNFLYFSTLYAFWVGLFGACQAINTEMKSGEWCYWVLGMGRNQAVHVLAIFVSCLLFALIQCIVFLSSVIVLSGVVNAPFNHFVEMFVSTGTNATVDPIYQMNGVLWYVLSAKWGALGPAAFATIIFGFALVSALVTGTSFGLLFGALFRDPATSLNIAVGFIVLLGMVSLCGLQGDGTEKVDALFAPLREWRTVYATMSREHFASNATPAAVISCALPQRYFFNIGRVTFNKDWSDEDKVQKALRGKLIGEITDSEKEHSSSMVSNALMRYKARWTQTNDKANFDVSDGLNALNKWISGWGCGFPSKEEKERYFTDGNEPKPCEVVSFLKRHPEHRIGWKVALHQRLLLATIGLEALPLLLLNVLCLFGTLLAVWNKPCYRQLR